MTTLQANCPACGAPVSFKTGSSIVVVCEFCHSVVARTDRALEDLGKVAEIADTGSPLDIGLKGTSQHVSFELTGRVQLGHEAGGSWDEWYAAFADGRWGWLAEAQGRFYLTFEFALPEPDATPSFEALQLGHPVAAIPLSVPLIVAEKGTARTTGAKGEIPWRVVPNQTYSYADLSGPGQTFATIDYSQTPPLVFVGKEVTLAEIGLAEARAPERETKHTAAAQLSCPNCGGPLQLHAPDRSERVTCPNCASLLDIHQGRLEFLKALEPGRFQPSIPLGTVGKLSEGEFTVIGFVTRSVTFDQTYFWFEYLLYNPQLGYRWLVQSDDHWSYVKSVPLGEVSEGAKVATFQGREFKLFQDATATVEYVSGEFYWKVSVGEKARAIDYISPPEMLSIELSTIVSPEVYQSFGKTPIDWGYQQQGQAASGEINCSLGTYLKREEVEKAFGVSGLARPGNVAPNQPNLFHGLGKYWAAFAGLTLVLGIIFFATAPDRQVFSQDFHFEALPNADGTQTAFSEPFTLAGRKNISITGASDVDNSWVYFEGDLINQDTGLVQPFELPVEYYHGVEDGEDWSEGAKTTTIYLSALPAGTYTLRLEGQWEHWEQASPSVGVRIVQGAPRLSHLLLALIFVSIIPAYSLLRRLTFEKRRWKDSMYPSFASLRSK
jgi:Zn finger protein HypA/HybF involved in hydrogenase expression